MSIYEDIHMFEVHIDRLGCSFSKVLSYQKITFNFLLQT